MYRFMLHQCQEKNAREVEKSSTISPAPSSIKSEFSFSRDAISSRFIIFYMLRVNVPSQNLRAFHSLFARSNRRETSRDFSNSSSAELIHQHRAFSPCSIFANEIAPFDHTLNYECSFTNKGSAKKCVAIFLLSSEQLVEIRASIDHHVARLRENSRRRREPILRLRTERICLPGMNQFNYLFSFSGMEGPRSPAPAARPQ